MTLYTVCFFACAADIPFFCAFAQRLDVSGIAQGSSLFVVVDMIITEPSYLLYFFVFLVVAVGWWLLGRSIYRRVLKQHLDSRIGAGWTVGIFVLLFLALFTGMRGHLTDRPPLRVEHSVFCNNPFLNQIGLNPVFTFVQSVESKHADRKHPLQLIDSDIAQEVFDSREALPADDTTVSRLPEGTHVVLVIMESMATGKTCLGAPDASLTPHLDSVMAAGLTFTRIFSAGIHTFNGIYSTLYGHPAILERHTMHDATVPLVCGLPQYLRAAGYSTAYFMPHQGYFDGMESFLYSNGYGRVFEQGSYPREEWINSFGIPDHLLFRHALDYINQVSRKGPSFTTIMTCSDHPPYALPQDIPFHPKTDDIDQQIVEYADWSIGWFLSEVSKKPWFENTLFVFVADHGAYDAPIYDLPISRNLIPLVFYSPGRIAPAFTDRLALQIDVAPTVLGLLGVDYGNTMIGIDVIHHRRPYAFFGSGKMIGATDGELLYIYRHESRTTTLHDYQHRSTADISDQMPERKSEMERYALGMVQKSYQMLRDKTTDCAK